MSVARDTLSVVLLQKAAPMLDYRATMLGRREVRFRRITTARDALTETCRGTADLLIIELPIRGFIDLGFLDLLFADTGEKRPGVIVLHRGDSPPGLPESCVSVDAQGGVAAFNAGLNELRLFAGRRAARRPMHLAIGADGAPLGHTLTVSTTGMLLMSRVPLKVGGMISFEFLGVGSLQGVIFSGRVLRAETAPVGAREHGYAIEFIHLHDPRNAQRLESLLSSYEDAQSRSGA